MTTFRHRLTVCLIALALSVVAVAQTQPAQIQITDGPIPIRVLSQGPADTDTELQVICLFRSDPVNVLHGSLTEMNEKLKGLLVRIRTPQLFRGDLGETLLLAPGSGTILAKKLLVIGLGDSQAFTPDRMELIGSIVYREASRLGIRRPCFAPTVLDGGVTKFTTGQTAEQVIHGFLRAQATESALTSAGDAAGVTIQDLTYLAGPQYASTTRDGIEKALAAAR
jgi:hypothetical protein